MTNEITMRTTREWLLYLADQQRYMRSMMNDDDYRGIRESIMIEAALRRWVDSLTKATPVGWMGDVSGNPFGPFDR